jgi:hypothetical protein
VRNRDAPDGGHLPERLRRFAEIAEPGSPLSARLARGMAESDVALDILAEAPHGQPAANILLAAVHFLLLGGAEHPLRDHYPSVGDAPTPDADPMPNFEDFCRRERGALIELVSTRTVQTNEVRRCVALRPAIAHAAASSDVIALLEIGPSAGLNLLLDRYHYDYGDGIGAGPLDAGLTLTTTRRGTEPLPLDLPRIAWRRGIDLHPLDVTDADDMRWVRALLWPEQSDRMERFDAAAEIARTDPPKLVQGDAVDDLGDLIATAPADARVIVFHSFVINQFTDSQRSRLRDALVAADRPIDRISIEMLSRGAEAPEILHTRYDGGEHPAHQLGTAHHHGEWIAWHP